MRVLMLGNSLTAANDLPKTLAGLLGAEVLAHTRGGARLSEHLNPVTRMGQATSQVLSEGGIDVVVLQDASTQPVRYRQAYLRSVCSLTELARSSGAVPVLFCTWALGAGSAPLRRLGLGPEEFGAALESAFEEARELSLAGLADVRAAFAGADDPDGLLRADGVHPSERGSALAARVIARACREASGA